MGQCNCTVRRQLGKPDLHFSVNDTKSAVANVVWFGRQAGHEELTAAISVQSVEVSAKQTMKFSGNLLNGFSFIHC